MDSIWQRAKTLAEEATKRSQALTSTSPAKIADIVSETAKRSKDFAAKKAGELRAVDLKSFADQHLKSLADQIPALSLADPSPHSPADSELERFGITDDLRQFIKGFTTTTFQSFPTQDDSSAADVRTVSNVRQDLSEWQKKHATLVLASVKQISKLRYELCPRHMTDAKFWRIYFTLVSSHVTPYEKKYMEEIKLKEAEKAKDEKQTLKVGEASKSEVKGTNLKSQLSTSSSAEQDLDKFLLGDLDSDGGQDDGGDETFDDDFDKIDGLDVEDDK